MTARRTATAMAIAAIGVIVTAVLLLSGGDDSREVGPQAVLHVDPKSLGGRCSDDREPLAVRSPSRPWCTLRRAISAAPPDTTLLLRAATYPATSIERDPTRRLRLKGFPGERAVLRAVAIDGGGVRLERLHITGTVRLLPGAARVSLVKNRLITDGRSGGTNVDITAGVRNVLVVDNRIAQRGAIPNANAINFSSSDELPPIRSVTLRDNTIGPIEGGGDAIQAKNTRSLVVEGNEIFGVKRPPASGAHPDAFQSIYGATGLIVRRNFIHDIDAQGLFIQEFRGQNARVRIDGNVIARVMSPWTSLSMSADGAVISRNTIDGKALLGAGSTRTVVVGNIASGGLIIDPEAGVDREENNLASRFAGPPGPGSIAGLPQFRDSAGDDFRLVPGTAGAGSGPSGSDVGAPVSSFSDR